MEHDAAGLGDLDALRALGNTVRRRLYEAVAAAGRAVGRDEAARSAGISRSLAAYHLDKLVGHGLLEASFERQGGRTGPGAGRPAKLYRRARREFVLRAPPRDYRLLGELLVRAAAGDQSGVVTPTLERVAYESGRELVEAERSQTDPDPSALPRVLRTRGYEPFEAEPGILRLRNCPFETVAAEYRDIVCPVNLGLVQGIIDGLATHARAVLEPGEHRCCVAVKPTEGGTGRTGRC